MDITAEQRAYARVAGVVLLLKTALEGFGDGVTIIGRRGESFVEIARFASQSEVLWRISLLSVAAAWIAMGFLAFALYVVLEPANKRLAQLALALRLGGCFVGAASVMFRFAQAWLYRFAERPDVFTTEQLRALVSVVQRGSGEGVETAWIFQSMGSMLCYVILLRSRYLPAALARSGVVGSLLLLTVSAVMIVEPRYINTLKLFGLPLLLVDVITSVLFIRGLRSRAPRPALA